MNQRNPIDAPTKQAPSSEQPATPVSAQELQSWIRFRTLYGLRADVDFVLQLAHDPAASVDPYDVPLLPAELQIVAAAQSSAQTLVLVARQYGQDFPEFAGAWLELPRVVLGFSDGIAERRAEVQSLFGDKVLVQESRFSLHELQAFMASVESDRAWFSTVGAEIVDIGIDEMLNKVRVHLRAPVRSLEDQARERFSDTGWLGFTYSRPGPWQGPVGGLEVAATDTSGQRAPVTCLLGSTDPRVQDEKIVDGPDGKCVFENLPAVTWSLRVDYDAGGQSDTEIVDVVVSADRVEQVHVVVGE